MTVSFAAADGIAPGTPLVGVPVFADLTVAGAGPRVNVEFLRRCGFEGQPGQAAALPGDDGTVVVAVGVGPAGAVDGDVLRRAGAALARQATRVPRLATTLATVAPRPELAAAVVEGIRLGAYRFAGSRTKPPTHALTEAVIVGADAAHMRRGALAAEATCRARDWVNEPPREMTPSRLAELARELGVAAGFDVRVWDGEKILAERLGGLAGVAAGGTEPPRLVRMAYEPPGATRTVALVGKGITFDSGGLSLKPAAGMMTMKSDMGGAAAVLAALTAAADLGVGVRVVGWFAATENMPSGTAVHPGDVLVARNGTSIGVLNTDAEGRLVLADALSLAAEEAPDAIIDIATLTGAQRVALGGGVAAVLGNDDDLVTAVVDAGAVAGEPTWRLPLVTAYRKQPDSDVADIKNVAAAPAAGTIMAALFLQEFVGGCRWAHLDIAAPSWSDSDEGWLSKGGTGWGARTLLEVVHSFA